jgi:hypothetical protein
MLYVKKTSVGSSMQSLRWRKVSRSVYGLIDAIRGTSLCRALRQQEGGSKREAARGRQQEGGSKREAARGNNWGNSQVCRDGRGLRDEWRPVLHPATTLFDRPKRMSRALASLGCKRT